jgi:hypothetical protein
MKEGWIMTNSTHPRTSVAVFDYIVRSNKIILQVAEAIRQLVPPKFGNTTARRGTSPEVDEAENYGSNDDMQPAERERQGSNKCL